MKGSVSSIMKPSAATAAPAEPAILVMTARSALKKLASGFWRTLRPSFLHDGLDDFFSGTTRIAAHATILIERELPEGVVLVDDPSATSVVFARGVPSYVNTPALDPALMADIRNPDLQAQAAGAIDRHAQPAVPPTAQQLDAIAEFQQTDNRFFSSKALKAFADGGPAPALPAGHTASEKRGREFFVDAPWAPNKRVCPLSQRASAEHGE